VKLQQVKQCGEREREQQINGEREGTLDRNGSGMGLKWPLEKLNT
jgi:hypothetical protein